MKKHPAVCRRIGSVLAAMSLLLTLASCRLQTPADSDDTPAETVPLYEAITLPDLTDDRTPTSIDNYTSRIEAAFAATETTPAEQFTYTVAEDGVTVTSYIGGEVVVVIPDTIEGKPVVTIAEGAFAGKGTLQALSIPDSVHTIGIGALEDCGSLTTLRTPVYTCHTAPYFGALFGATTYEINAAYVPSTLSTLILTAGESIPDCAFYGCSGLEVVALPATMTEIGEFAFYGNRSLVCIPLEDTALTSIGERAFTGCDSLLRLDIPATVMQLGAAMLEGCGQLETLTLPFVGGCRLSDVPHEDDSEAEDGTDTDPADTTYLGYLFGASDYTFTAGYIPASLIRVTLLEGCGDIPANAFFECASVREVILPEGVSAIERRAFYGCERLSAITLPDSVTSVGDDAFHGCIRLVSVTVGAGLCELGVQVFMNCVSLTDMTLPASVTALPNSCFAGCSSLTTLTAPGVTTVGRQAFRHCDKLEGWDEAVPASE